jgi:hypothetical protein
VFQEGEAAAHGRLLCYINADILLTGDFLAAVRSINVERFLMIGRRWGLDPAHVPPVFDFEWETTLRSRVAAHGELGIPDQVDYFLFTRGLWSAMPPFALGRLVWDNWLVYAARAGGAQVVDATPSVLAVHQNHDYSHYAPGRPAEGYAAIERGQEAARNRALAGDIRFAFTVRDATRVLRSGRLERPRVTPRRLYRRIEAAALLHPEPSPMWYLAQTGLGLARRAARRVERYRRLETMGLRSKGRIGIDATGMPDSSTRFLQ